MASFDRPAYLIEDDLRRGKRTNVNKARRHSTPPSTPSSATDSSECRQNFRMHTTPFALNMVLCVHVNLVVVDSKRYDARGDGRAILSGILLGAPPSDAVSGNAGLPLSPSASMAWRSLKVDSCAGPGSGCPATALAGCCSGAGVLPSKVDVDAGRGALQVNYCAPI